MLTGQPHSAEPQGAVPGAQDHNRPADIWVQRGQRGSRATRRSRHSRRSAPEVMMAMSGENTANSVMARINRFQGSESSRRQPACGRVSGASRAWWVNCWQQGRPNVRGNGTGGCCFQAPQHRHSSREPAPQPHVLPAGPQHAQAEAGQPNQAACLRRLGCVCGDIAVQHAVPINVCRVEGGVRVGPRAYDAGGRGGRREAELWCRGPSTPAADGTPLPT